MQICYAMERYRTETLVRASSCRSVELLISCACAESDVTVRSGRLVGELVGSSSQSPAPLSRPASLSAVIYQLRYVRPDRGNSKLS